MSKSPPVVFISSNKISTSCIYLDPEKFHHLFSVLRLKINDHIILTCGQGTESLVQILKVNSKTKCLNLSLIDCKKHLTKTPKIILGIPLLKNSFRNEFMIEKMTEIGVHEIYPLITQHTEFYKLKESRVQKIIESALEQSQQYFMPKFHPPIPFPKFVELDLPKQKFIAHCNSAKENLLHLNLTKNDCCLIIGPEGDFSSAEIKLAQTHHFNDISLGINRLRSETAVIYSLAVINEFFH